MRTYCITQETLLNTYREKEKMVDKEFPGGPVSETPHSPMQAAWVLSLVKELDPICCN